MVARTSHCEPQQLQQAIAGELAEPAATRLSQHLQVCLHCRAELERLAGDAQWWDDARAYLGSTPTLDVLPTMSGATTFADPLLAQNSMTKNALPDEDLDEAVEAPLDFLTPSTLPGSLGKLGDYEVDAVIGRGGMGIVFRGHDPSLNRHVAIKVLARPLASSAAARRRFTREAQAAAAVVHENVIPIHCVGLADHTPFLVMQLVLGHSLQDRIDVQGPLHVEEVLRIAMQTARGLAAAHAQGLVHRDIKPANILLEKGIDRVRITDFGLARAVDDASQTQSGFIAGTPQYMAPEQARGEPIDARADLFCLGSVMYAMCTGHPPFRAETTLAVLRRICDDTPRDVRQSNAAVPVWLASIVHRLLAKRPEERYASANEVAALLEQWLAHWQQPTIIAAPVMPQTKKRKRSRFVSAALTATAIAIGLTVWFTWPPADEFQPPAMSEAAVAAPAAPTTPKQTKPKRSSRSTPSSQQVATNPEPWPDEQAPPLSVTYTFPGAPTASEGNSEFGQEILALDQELRRLESQSFTPEVPNQSLQQSITELSSLLGDLESSLQPVRRPPQDLEEPNRAGTALPQSLQPPTTH